MEGVKLRPCPFCGGEESVEHLENGRWSVGCDDVACIGFISMATFARRFEAIAAWNTRTPDAGELVEALGPFANADIDVSGTAAVGVTAEDILRARNLLASLPQ